MADDKHKTKAAILNELESIKDLLLEDGLEADHHDDEIPVLSQVFNSPDFISPDFGTSDEPSAYEEPSAEEEPPLLLPHNEEIPHDDEVPVISDQVEPGAVDEPLLDAEHDLEPPLLTRDDSIDSPEMDKSLAQFQKTYRAILSDPSLAEAPVINETAGEAPLLDHDDKATEEAGKSLEPSEEVIEPEALSTSELEGIEPEGTALDDTENDEETLKAPETEAKSAAFSSDPHDPLPGQQSLFDAPTEKTSTKKELSDASVEPSANGEPSADKEPSVDGEPSADREAATSNQATAPKESTPQEDSPEQKAANTQSQALKRRPSLQKPTGENPFLPKHIRDRLHGNRPFTGPDTSDAAKAEAALSEKAKADKGTATDTKAPVDSSQPRPDAVNTQVQAINKEPLNKEPLNNESPNKEASSEQANRVIQEVIAEFMPRIEAELRLRLEDLLEDSLCQSPQDDKDPESR